MWRNIVCLQCSGTRNSRRSISPGSHIGIAQPFEKFVSAVWCTKTAVMIIRLGRLTPGYFRLLQRQVAGEVQAPARDRSVNQIAMMLAIMGLSMSYYSAKQMTEKVHREPAP
ncbi:hypothetical protein R3I93_009519 [Phoxinus phoxinus]|uniref:Uncharacterized protein n=1 Tax=Phoxinus phoxinus TaxID=58324 RepID=A0AAN9D4F7_9TELE